MRPVSVIVAAIVAAYNHADEHGCIGGGWIGPGDVVPTRDGEGWQISAAFCLAKQCKMNPREFASLYADAMEVPHHVVTVVGPGFIEIRPDSESRAVVVRLEWERCWRIVRHRARQRREQGDGWATAFAVNALVMMRPHPNTGRVTRGLGPFAEDRMYRLCRADLTRMRADRQRVARFQRALP